MEKEILILLLQAIEDNGDVDNLKHYGYNYEEIGNSLSEGISKGYLILWEDKLVVSETGKRLLEKKINVDKKNWIKPEIKSRIPKLSKDDIYLPNQNDLWFN